MRQFYYESWVSEMEIPFCQKEKPRYSTGVPKLGL